MQASAGSAARVALPMKRIEESAVRPIMGRRIFGSGDEGPISHDARPQKEPWEEGAWRIALVRWSELRISNDPRYPMAPLRYPDLPGRRRPTICIYQMKKRPLSGYPGWRWSQPDPRLKND